MNSNKCLPQALSYYQSTQGHGGHYPGPADGNTGNVVLPKAKVGVVVELDLGSGNLRLTESCDHHENRVHKLTVNEVAEILAGSFGALRASATTTAAADYGRQWQDFLARIRTFLCDDTQPPASVNSLDQCREELARVKKTAATIASKLRTDVGMNHGEVVRLAVELADASK